MGISRLKQELGNLGLLRWLLSFLALEGAIGLGNLLGVAHLDPKYVDGMEVSILREAMIDALVPVLFISLWISRRDALTTTRWTFALGFASFLASMAFSYWIGLA